MLEDDSLVLPTMMPGQDESIIPRRFDTVLVIILQVTKIVCGTVTIVYTLNTLINYVDNC